MLLFSWSHSRVRHQYVTPLPLRSISLQLKVGSAGDFDRGMSQETLNMLAPHKVDNVNKLHYERVEILSTGNPEWLKKSHSKDKTIATFLKEASWDNRYVEENCSYFCL